MFLVAKFNTPEKKIDYLKFEYEQDIEEKFLELSSDGYFLEAIEEKDGMILLRIEHRDESNGFALFVHHVENKDEIKAGVHSLIKYGWNSYLENKKNMTKKLYVFTKRN